MKIKYQVPEIIFRIALEEFAFYVLLFINLMSSDIKVAIKLMVTIKSC